MAYFNARAERERKRRDNNPDRILQLVKQKGSFSVSLRWRDDALRALCIRMRKQGLLTGGRRVINGALIFYPAQGTEARRAETGTGSVHDGPVATAMRQDTDFTQEPQ